MRKSNSRFIIISGIVLAGIGVLFLLIAFKPRKIEFEKYERSVFSQSGEDGILEKIFEIIKPTHRYAIEFGAGDGIKNSNVRHLITHQDWGGLLIEGDDKLADVCEDNYIKYPKVRTLQAWIYPGNIELIFEENSVPKDLDLLIIDIDSNDYYVWKAIHDFRPKVVQIEFNGTFAPPQKMVVDFYPMNYWDEESFYYGASIQSLYELGKRKGYELIYVNRFGLNLFFVDKKYFKRFGIKDNFPIKLFRPHMLGKTFTVNNKNQITHPDGLFVPGIEDDLVYSNLKIRKKFHFNR